VTTVAVEARGVVTPERFARGMTIEQYLQVPRPGETKDEAWPRFIRDWGALQQSPFWWLWASAGIDEILSALHERQLVKETAHGDA
jgi:hypothetical protein